MNKKIKNDYFVCVTQPHLHIDISCVYDVKVNRLPALQVAVSWFNESEQKNTV